MCEGTGTGLPTPILTFKYATALLDDSVSKKENSTPIKLLGLPVKDAPIKHTMRLLAYGAGQHRVVGS
jgi:hypothetical protein